MRPSGERFTSARLIHCLASGAYQRVSSTLPVNTTSPTRARQRPSTTTLSVLNVPAGTVTVSHVSTFALLVWSVLSPLASDVLVFVVPCLPDKQRKRKGDDFAFDVRRIEHGPCRRVEAIYPRVGEAPTDVRQGPALQRDRVAVDARHGVLDRLDDLVFPEVDRPRRPSIADRQLRFSDRRLIQRDGTAGCRRDGRDQRGREGLLRVHVPDERDQADFASSSKCSTAGGAAKYGPTIARHCANSGPWRKSTV